MLDEQILKLFWWRPLRWRLLLGLRHANQTLFAFPPKVPFDNFGDALSPLIVSALSLKTPVRVSKRSKGKLIAVGSVMYAARAGDSIWGTGAWGMEKLASLDKISFLAVRGPLTRQKILKHGGACPEIYGDPAMLCPYLFKAADVERSGIGIFPHFYHYSYISRTIKDPAITILNPMEDPLVTIDKLTRCSVICSSSLHGLIVAEAYGIPAVWVKISGSIEGGDSKYHDYYMATLRDAICCDWRQEINLKAASKLAEKFQMPKLDLEPLLNAFPYLHPSKQNLLIQNPS